MPIAAHKTINEVARELAPPATKAAAYVTNGMATNYFLNELARTSTYDPDSKWKSLVPWYTATTERASGLIPWAEHAAHLGEIALFTIPLGGLYGVGYRLATRGNEAAIRGDRVHALALTAGSAACYAAAGAWATGINTLTPSNHFAHNHAVEITGASAFLSVVIGEAIDLGRHVRARRAARPRL